LVGIRTPVTSIANWFVTRELWQWAEIGE